ncbi:MAG TPA: lysylphosphatidylglycerol synthase transmembrane domain-containing protein [Nocardioidaceae bacterium]|nr:lysylphosphatidylglycerol synthase transmembrane domain-containing protein [Nocardioidaceae bacterium]
MLGGNRSLWAWTRLTVGTAILTVLVWRLGTEPFLQSLHRIDVWSLLAASGIAAATTVCCAWRWRLVSRCLGSQLALRGAVAAYYRSQFLNTALPGGVLGDVHRAVRRGRDVGDVPHGIRAVVWERTAGQVVQVALTLGVLLVVPSAAPFDVPVVVGAVVMVTLGAVLLGRKVPRSAPWVLARVARALESELRAGMLTRRTWPGITLASTVVVAGHAATFLLAARTVGSTVSPVRMLPLALLVLLAAGLPTNVAGWGPREGAAAWVFAGAGLGATQGVAVAVVYGVMALVATLPGAGVLVADWLRPERVEADVNRAPVAAVEGVAHG